jgi:hypothetical protein
MTQAGGSNEKGLGLVTKETGITIGLVIALFGGVFWLSSMYATVQSTADRIEKLEPKVDVLNERTIRIEAALTALEADSKDVSFRD